jgi:hypothetical protein
VCQSDGMIRDATKVRSQLHTEGPFTVAHCRSRRLHTDSIIVHVDADKFGEKCESRTMILMPSLLKLHIRMRLNGSIMLASL